MGILSMSRCMFLQHSVCYLQNSGGDDIQIFAPEPKSAESVSELSVPSDPPAPSDPTAPTDPATQVPPDGEIASIMDEEFAPASDEMFSEPQGDDEEFQPAREGMLLVSSLGHRPLTFRSIPRLK